MKALSWTVVALSVFLTACEQHGARHHQDEHETADTHGVEFDEHHGLSISPAARESLGLKMVEVKEGQALRRIDLALRAFKFERSSGGETILASAPVDSRLLPHLTPGTSVKIEVPAEGEGEVLRIETGPADLTGLAEVIVKFPMMEGVGLGAFLDGQVIATKEQVPVIPGEAVLATAEGTFAYVEEDGSIQRRRIAIGAGDGAMVEVAEGLRPGEKVVLRPIMPLWLAEVQALRGGEGAHAH